MSANRGNPTNKRKLYKDPDQAKICGVCAGLAEYLGFEIWVVRVITLAFLLLTALSGPIVISYFILCFVLDPKPGSTSSKGCFGKTSKLRSKEREAPLESKPYQPTVREVWRSGASLKDTLDDVEAKFETIEGHLQRMESFVTSSQFELEKAFNRMK